MLTALRPSSGSTAGIRQTLGATGYAPGSVQSATLGGCGTRSLPFESGKARMHANLVPVPRTLALVCARSLSRLPHRRWGRNGAVLRYPRLWTIADAFGAELSYVCAILVGMDEVIERAAAAVAEFIARPTYARTDMELRSCLVDLQQVSNQIAAAMAELSRDAAARDLPRTDEATSTV